MNAEGLLAHYARIADAPDAIARLRRFVLDLAVRGKLSEQQLQDDPAPHVSPVDVTTGSYSVPRGWRAATVGAALEFQYGKGLKASERLERGPIPVYGSNGVVGYTGQPLTTQPAIIVGRKGSAGALNLADGPSWTTDVAYYVEAPPYFNIQFLMLALEALGLDRLGKGVKPGLSRSDAYQQIVLVPPLAEQHRIVAKVDLLMALCDQLEAARAQRESTRDRLAAASLALLNAPDPDTFPADARFALDALPALTTRTDQIKQLRQTILNLAVRGKLVPLDTSEESAASVLGRLHGDLPKPKNALDPEAAWPFAVPTGWSWTAFGQVITSSDAGWSPKTLDHPAIGDAWGVLKVSAVSWGRFQGSENKQLTAGMAPRLQAAIHHNDFLISRANTSELVARAVIVDIEPKNLMMSDKIVRLHLSEHINPRFCLVVNNYAAHAREHYARLATGVSPSMKNISRDVIMRLPFPMPPLKEQHRIVAKVDELMALCDQLEASLTTGETARRRLLDALLHEALAPAAEASSEYPRAAVPEYTTAGDKECFVG